MPRKNLWLCLPPTLVCLFDNAMTLWHQPAAYWAGDYVIAKEAAPHGLWLLKQHPLAFEAAMLGYILFFCFVIVYMRKAVAMVIAAALVFGHLNAATTWIALERPLDGYWINLVICVAGAIVLVASWTLTQPPPKLPEALRPEKELPRTLAERFRRQMEEER